MVDSLVYGPALALYYFICSLLSVLSLSLSLSFYFFLNAAAAVRLHLFIFKKFVDNTVPKELFSFYSEIK